MSSIIPGKNNRVRRQKMSYNTLYDERMTSLQTGELSSGFELQGLMHSDTDFTSSPKQEKNKKAMSNDVNVLDIR